MNDAFVVDASVAVAWVHPAQATSVTNRCLDSMVDGARLVVPALWPLEVANALTVLVRRGRLTDGDRVAALRWLPALRVQVDDVSPAVAFSELARLASDYGISVYDAAYLELAARRRLPLGCGDGPLRAAARRHRVDLLAV